MRLLILSLVLLAGAVLSAFPQIFPPTELSAYLPLLFLALAPLFLFEAGVSLSRSRKEGKVVEEEKQPEVSGPDALTLLSLLQSKGRFVDFVMEDIAPYSEAQVAAASRVVHQGCAEVVREYLKISPLAPETEGARVTVPGKPDEYRFIGKVSGDGPYAGKLIHRGWKVEAEKLPRGKKSSVIAPAEVEV